MLQSEGGRVLWFVFCQTFHCSAMIRISGSLFQGYLCSLTDLFTLITVNFSVNSLTHHTLLVQLIEHIGLCYHIFQKILHSSLLWAFSCFLSGVWLAVPPDGHGHSCAAVQHWSVHVSGHDGAKSWLLRGGGVVFWAACCRQGTVPGPVVPNDRPQGPGQWCSYIMKRHNMFWSFWRVNANGVYLFVYSFI